MVVGFITTGTYIIYIVAVSFISGENLDIQRKPLTSRMALTSFKFIT
jgi:hypothetical protein